MDRAALEEFAKKWWNENIQLKRNLKELEQPKEKIRELKETIQSLQDTITTLQDTITKLEKTDHGEIHYGKMCNPYTVML